MPEYRTFRDRSSRLPTAAEVQRARELMDSGVADVFVPLDRAPAQYWEAMLQAVTWSVMSLKNFASPTGRTWWDELRWQEGWPPIDVLSSIPTTFEGIVRRGAIPFSPGPVEPRLRISAIEHLLDVMGESADMGAFTSLANEAADRFRVGLRLEGTRFLEVTSELIHREVVKPALVILASPELKPIDDLYRKAFDRLLSGDSAGAITAASSAVEEMLRAGGLSGSTLKQLSQRARENDWITPGVEQSIVKLDAFRGDSDAHRVGTDEKELARLVLNITGALLLYLGRTSPNQTR